MSEKLKSKRCYAALNHLANLYVRAYYAYGWLRDIFQKDDLLQDLSADYTEKTEETKKICQKILDFLFESKNAFQLQESSGHLEIDLFKVLSLKDGIRAATSEVLAIAEEKTTRF